MKRKEKKHRMLRLIGATCLGRSNHQNPKGLQCYCQWSFRVFSCLDITFLVTEIIQDYCFYFQIDNQHIGTVFPVALYPSPLPVSVIQRSGTCWFFDTTVTSWKLELWVVMKFLWGYATWLWGFITSCWKQTLPVDKVWLNDKRFEVIRNFLCIFRSQQAIKACVWFSIYCIGTQTSI